MNKGPFRTNDSGDAKYRRLSTGFAAARLGRLLAALLFFAIPPMHAMGAHRVVLAEDFTATWCGGCQLAGPALSTLLDNYPNDIVAFECHQNDDYATPWGTNRYGNYYHFGVLPTVAFDGATAVVGVGSWNTQDYYNHYVNALNARRNAPTNVLVDVSATPAGWLTFDVTTTVSLEAGGTAQYVRISLAQARDHWPTNPSHSRNTFQDIVEDGTIRWLRPGESVDIHSSVTLEQWQMQHLEDVKMIAWAQPRSSFEVYNAVQYSMDSPRTGDFDEDGDVDGNDFLVWQQGGSPNGATSSDLARWQDHFGEGAGASAFASAVPEPASALLAMLGLGWLAATRRRRRTA